MKIGIKALSKILILDKYIERKHRELAPTRHWYLAVLAVDSQYQGKGCASKLLNENLSNIDNKSLLCNLEAGGEKNVFMYQHFDFEVIDEFIALGIEDKVVAMLRHLEADW